MPNFNLDPSERARSAFKRKGLIATVGAAALGLLTVFNSVAFVGQTERGIDAAAGSDTGPDTAPGAVFSAAPAAAAASAPAGHRSVPRRGRPPGRR